MQKLSRTEFALQTVKDHITKSTKVDPVLQSYLVQYLSVCFYCEVEQHVKSILSGRIKFAGDERLEHFVIKQHDKMIGRVKKSEINCVLELFGNDCRSNFDKMVAENQISYYSNAILGRHDTCHEGTSKLTLEDIEKALPAAREVLDAIETVIR